VPLNISHISTSRELFEISFPKTNCYQPLTSSNFRLIVKSSKIFRDSLIKAQQQWHSESGKQKINLRHLTITTLLYQKIWNNWYGLTHFIITLVLLWLPTSRVIGPIGVFISIMGGSKVWDIRLILCSIYLYIYLTGHAAVVQSQLKIPSLFCSAHKNCMFCT